MQLFYIKHKIKYNMDFYPFENTPPGIMCTYLTMYAKNKPKNYFFV